MPDRPKPLALVVDDEPDVAKALASPLEQSGYVTAVAYTGKDVGELASRTTATLAIVEVNLPDVDGIGHFQAIKHVERVGGQHPQS